MILRTVKSGSAGNCYCLIGKDGSLILDAGASFNDVKKALNYDISSVDGCLVTHIHGDHVKHAKELTRAGIKVFSNQETADGYGKGIISLREKSRYKIGNFTVIPFYVPHISIGEDGETENCPNFAYIIQSDEIGTMLYATDYEYIPYTFTSLKLDHMLIECNHVDNFIRREHANFEHVVRGHASLNTVIGIVKVNATTSLKNVILCHLSARNADGEEMVEAVKKVAGAGVCVRIADKGSEIQLLNVPFLGDF